MTDRDWIVGRTPEPGWVIAPNPKYEGKTPRLLKAECHDRTPFVSVRCRCGGEMHLHESQTAAFPADAEVASTCKSCGEVMVFPPGYFAQAFAEMRADGWIE